MFQFLNLQTHGQPLILHFNLGMHCIVLWEKAFLWQVRLLRLLFISVFKDVSLYLGNPPLISMIAWSRPTQRVCESSEKYALYINIKGPYVTSIHVVPELKAFSCCWWIFRARQHCLFSWPSWRRGFNVHVITFCCSKGVVICGPSAETCRRTTLACPVKVIRTKTLTRIVHQVYY